MCGSAGLVIEGVYSLAVEVKVREEERRSRGERRPVVDVNVEPEMKTRRTREVQWRHAIDQ